MLNQSDVQFVTKSQVEIFQDLNFKSDESKIEKQIVLLHGWNSSGNDMLRIKDAIAKLPKANNYRFWWVTYDTNAPFKENAKKIIDLLNEQNTNFDDCLMVCYSMGGVVGRSMYAQGFNIKNLVTICTPHLGLAPWIPTPTHGLMSIAPWSQDLRELNTNPTDIAKRNSYYFFGITYTDVRGKHNDDSVVEISSAVGSVLGLTKKVNISLEYNNGLAGSDPHSRGMDPAFLGPMLRQINELL